VVGIQELGIQQEVQGVVVGIQELGIQELGIQQEVQGKVQGKVQREEVQEE